MKNNFLSLKYKNLTNLINYSQKFINLTLGDAFILAKSINSSLPDMEEIIENKKLTDKGLIGKLIEILIYGIPNNSNSCPDFNGLIESNECVPDLKVTQLLEYKKYPGQYRAKERLTCTNITRDNLANCSNFDNSCYKIKCTNLLLFALNYKN